MREYEPYKTQTFSKQQSFVKQVAAIKQRQCDLWLVPTLPLRMCHQVPLTTAV